MKILRVSLIAAGLFFAGLAARAQGAAASFGKAAPLSAFDYAALEQMAFKKHDAAVQGAKPAGRNSADKAFTSETDPVILRRLMGEKQSQQMQSMSAEARKRRLDVSRHGEARQKAIRDSLWKKADYSLKGSFLQKRSAQEN